MISVWMSFLDAPGITNIHTVMYVYRKGSIEGPAWKAPFIGPFLDSVRPDFTKYYAKWASGPLSCVSVFHKYVFDSCSSRMSCIQYTDT
jgi:hypothetical protein